MKKNDLDLYVKFESYVNRIFHDIS